MDKRIEKQIEQLGCTIEDNGQTYYVDTPAGKIFAATGLHVLVAHYSNQGGQMFKRQAYADLKEWLAFGLDNCGVDNCDVCEENAT